MSIDIMGAKAEAPATRAAKAAVRIFSVEYDLVETRHFQNSRISILRALLIAFARKWFSMQESNPYYWAIRGLQEFQPAVWQGCRGTGCSESHWWRRPPCPSPPSTRPRRLVHPSDLGLLPEAGHSLPHHAVCCCVTCNFTSRETANSAGKRVALLLAPPLLNRLR